MEGISLGTELIIDPVTRIEGHMKIKVTIDDNNKVTSAAISGNLFRDFENILAGRHPWDAVHITQRICGVCPVSHCLSSTKAIEQAAGFTPSEQALLLRAIIQGAYFISDHILHFYHLNLLDYILSPKLSPLSPGYTNDMRMSDTNTQKLTNNYLEALKVRRLGQEMVALLAGRMPHVMTIAPGGVTLTPDSLQISNLKTYLAQLQQFVNEKYLPDTLLLADIYKDYYSIGSGPKNLISYDAFDLPSRSVLFKKGSWVNDSIKPLDEAKINEFVAYSYYASPTGQQPSSGTTVPSSSKQNAYSWLKAPRYDKQPFQTGPLARMKINGRYTGGVSVMDRIVARARETEMITKATSNWINQLVPKAQAYKDLTLPSNASGIGLTEAPRGSLGHWLKYSNHKITNYQIISPTCWNASPKDDLGVPGAMEQALVGTLVADPNQPVELLRIIHSFDPCISCAVHVISPKLPVREFVVNR
jgi:hydrogenase large subunit